MKIQWKFLSIAAYEVFVHNIKTVDIGQYIEQVLSLVYHAGCKC